MYIIKTSDLHIISTSCQLWQFSIMLTHWKGLWCWEGLGAGGEEEDRGWDGWMASLTRWTSFWVNSGSWWWTGRSGMLWFMGSQRVGHNWATELNWWLLTVVSTKTCRLQLKWILRKIQLYILILEKWWHYQSLFNLRIREKISRLRKSWRKERMIQWTRENRKSSNQTKTWFFENRKNLCKIIHKKRRLKEN